jgi:hypothetical protein
MPRDPQEIVSDAELSFQRIRYESSLEYYAHAAVLDKVQKFEYDVSYGQDPLRTTKDKPPIKIPEAPPGVDLDWNIKRARVSASPFWFVERLAPGGEMDYKVKDLKYENFGNFNYGSVALAFGFSEETALRAAGFVQVLVNIGRRAEGRQGGNPLEYGREHLFDFAGVPPFGDDQKDQEWIKQGFRYYNEVFLPKDSAENHIVTYKEVVRAINVEEVESHFSIISIPRWVR